MTRRLTSSALALAAMTAPAFADVTPEQVWQSWVDYYQSVGYSVTEGGRDASGSTLTVRDIVISGGADTGKVTIKLPQAVMTDTGDGKVKTVYADRMTVDVAGTQPEGGAYTLPITLDVPGNSTITSGAPEDMTHEFDYPTMNLAFTTMTSEGKETAIPMSFQVQDTTGKMHVAGTSPSKYDYDMAAKKVTFQGDVTGDNAQKISFAGNLDGIDAQGTMTAPAAGTDLETQMAAALRDGMAMDGVVKAGPMAATFDFAGTDENGQPTSGAGKYDSKGVDAGFKLSRDGMGYQVGSDALNFEMTSPQFPMPIRYGIENASFDMQLPVSQSETPQPFKLAYALAGLTIGDEMWAMFDPEAKLPRDPASLEIDLTGLMKVTKDLFDPTVMAPPQDPAPADATDEGTAPADDAEATAEAQATTDEAAAEPAPFEPVELTINQIALNALGAKVNASGNLKAPDSGDMTAPVGQVHAEYEGLNALLDTLGAMGLIPEDQMMGTRMMLAMFAKPVDGNPDKLTTDLEFKEGGQIFANGQQIK